MTGRYGAVSSSKPAPCPRCWVDVEPQLERGWWVCCCRNGDCNELRKGRGQTSYQAVTSWNAAEAVPAAKREVA
jgi:hypothetical protein